MIKLCNRPLAIIDEMNEKMIENSNVKVTNGDTIYILGDLFFRTNGIQPMPSRLKGKKHLLGGNHD